MKFFTKIIITIVLFTLCNTSFLYKSESKLWIIINYSVTNTVESETQTEIINFKRFVTEAHGHLMPSSGSCTDPSKCRSLNEMLYIAYERSIALKKELSFDKMFIASVQNKLDINGVSKILMTLPELVKAVGHDRGAVMFR